MKELIWALFDLLANSWLVSGTFWTAVAAVGSVVALFFIYSQIASATHVSAYEFLRREDDRFESPEMKRARSNLAKLLILCPQNYEVIDRYAETVCDYFEDLGLLLKEKITPEFFTWTMFSDYTIDYWTSLSSYVADLRVGSKDDTYYSEFEYLYKRMVRFEKKMRKTKEIKLTEQDRRSFLERELLVEIRHFTPDDLGHIMRIEKSAFDVGAYSEEQFNALYGGHPEGFFVAEMLGHVVGYVVGYISNGIGEIDSLAVDPSNRRLGIGRRLAEQILAYLCAQAPNLKEYQLEVRSANLPAIRLYEKMGFQKAKTLTAYYADGGDAYLMRKGIA